MRKPVSIVEWFDVDNKEHVDAYYHLLNEGSWPVGFIPDNIHRLPMWQLDIANKLANRWVEYMRSK